MAGFGEAFTVLAVFEAYDKMSSALEKMDASLDRFSETAQKTATVAAEAGARVDESMTATASGADAVELADARLATAREKLTAATEAQAKAEQALLDARGSVASEEELATAADAVAAAQGRATDAAATLKAAQANLKEAKRASVDQDALRVATEALAAAQGRAAESTDMLKAAQAGLSAAKAAKVGEDELRAALETLTAAQEAAAESARALKAAQADLRVAKTAQVDEEALKAALDAVADAEERAAASTRQLTAARQQQAALVTSDDVAKAADTLTAAEKKAAAATREVTTATARQAQVQGESAVKTDAAAAATGRADKASASAAEGSGLMGKAMNIGALAVAAVGYESVKAAANFQTLTTRLVTTAGEAPGQLQRIQQGILGISVQTGTSASELAKSMYIVEAAGYDAAHGGLDVLKASTEGAALEGSDFATVSNAVTDILKDYHLKAADSANVTSQLVAAVSSGKANFQQMSSSMANILPLAASVHLKFADVAGVLATMTSHGVSAQRASQNMANALRSLEAPTGTMTTEFKKLGITSDEVQQHLSTQGLSGTLQWLSQVAEKGAPKLGQTYPAALKALMGTAAGLNVALMTTGENAGQTAAAVARISKATADGKGNVSGFSNLQHTFAFQMDQAKAAINAAGISIGQVLLPAVTSIARAIAQVVGPMATWMSQHQKVVGLIAAVAGGILVGVGAMKAWAAIQGTINTLMAIFDAEAEANPIGLIVIAIAALVAGLIYAYTHFQTFRTIVQAVFGAVKDVIVGAWHVIQAVWNALAVAAQAVGHAFSVAFDAVASVAQTVWHVIAGVWDAIVSVTTTVWNGISGFFSKWWPLLLLIFATPIALLVGMWNHFHNTIESVAKTVWHALQSFFTTIWHGIQAVAEAAWTQIQLFIVTPIKIAWSILMTVVHAIGSFLSGAWNTILGVVKGAWNLIKQAIIDPLVGAWKWLMGWVNTFTQIGMNIIQGIINGLDGAWHWLTDKISNIASSALNAAKSILGIGSPSRRFADEVGKWIPHGIAAGIDEHAAVAHAAVQRLSKGLTASAQVAVAGSFSGTVAGAGLSAGPAGGGGGTVIVQVDLKNAVISGDAAMRQLADQVGKQIVRQFTTAGHKAVAF